MTCRLPYDSVQAVMGGHGKGSKGKIGDQIPTTRLTTTSESAYTHYREREECAGQRYGGAGADFLDPDLRCHGCPPKVHTFQEASSRLGEDGARAASHLAASTSPRCSFKWVERLLDDRLTKWTKGDAHDFKMSFDEVLNDPEPVWRYTSVFKSCLRHIIGRGGRVLRQLESFFGTFITICDLASDSLQGEVQIVGPRRACLLTEFAVEMIAGGHYSIVASLAHHGF